MNHLACSHSVTIGNSDIVINMSPITKKKSVGSNDQKVSLQVQHHRSTTINIFGHDCFRNNGRNPFNQNSDWSDWEKRTSSKGGPDIWKLFRLDRTDPLSFGPKFLEILVEWIAPNICHSSHQSLSHSVCKLKSANQSASQSASQWVSQSVSHLAS